MDLQNVLVNGQKSIIDFIIASDEMEEMVDSMIVDDKKEYSLFRITKNKKKLQLKLQKVIIVLFLLS